MGASAPPLLPHPSSRDGADDEVHGHDQERPHRSARGELRGEEGRDQHGLEHSREHCNDRGEEKRKVRHPGCCDDQDPPEEGGQGHRQGFPSESPQGRVLKASRSVANTAMRLRVFSSSSSRSSFIPPSEEYSCHFVQVGWRARGHAWPSGPRTLGEGDHMYSTSFSQIKK